ncbi:MAG: AmmeMemoRadiSam system protein B [Rhodoferax sp.]|nr:AmmeMemoRadiSam system protein B [Rhodoferax sp.]
MTTIIRPPATAGSFMQADPAALAREIDNYLQPAPSAAPVNCPKVLIAPHAGHIYSGRTAGRAYALLAPFGAAAGGPIRRVVLLGPAHRVYVKGVALPGADAFATPLGSVPVDTLGAMALADLPFVVTRADVHAQEHSLEVHLPFLQRVLGNFELLPLVVGDVAPAQVAELLDRLWGGPEVLVVISTDLSHFHSYDQANAIDSASCAQVMALDAALTHEQACGATPVNGLLQLARRKGLRITELERCNSGDTGANTPEGRQRVVGYASFALYEDEDQHVSTPKAQALTVEQGARVVQIARAALHAAVRGPTVKTASDDDLQMPGASFVTLTQQGQLRGCIGSLQAHRPLALDVRANAQAAALQDPRFSPVSAKEAPGLGVEVSVLTPSAPLTFANQAHALWQLRPGIDGVVFECVHEGRAYRSTFLPQVWEQLPGVVNFMAHLKVKAGLSANFWSPAVRLSVYQVQKFYE